MNDQSSAKDWKQSLSEMKNWNWTAILVNLFLAIICFVAFIFFAPKFSSQVIFGALRHWPYLATLLLAAYIAYQLLPGLDERGSKKRRSVILLITDGVLLVTAWILMSSFQGYATFHMFANFAERESLIVSDTDRLRFTALKVAHQDIDNSIGAATESVESTYTHPLVTEDGFAYVSPILPDGLPATWAGDNPGFVYYDDRSGLSTKIERFDQPQAYGINELWTDNIWWGVYHTDWWSTYEEPHFIRMDPENPDVFTAVIPQVKYRFWLLPYWAGTMLVHADGTIEELTAAQAKADPRLQGQWIAPLDLMREYVDLQDYAVGFVNSFFKVDGRLEIDDVEGLNKSPFFTRGGDGTDYFVVPTKAQGSGAGLFRMYYASADTFDLTYVEFDRSTLIYGPDAASRRVYNLQSYVWFTEENSAGKAVVVEPVYIVRPGDEDNLYWKFSITTKDFTGTSATVVVNARNPDVYQEFRLRSDFEAWLHSNQPLNVAIPQQGGSESSDETASVMEQILWHAQQIELLSQQLGTQTQSE